MFVFKSHLMNIKDKKDKESDKQEKKDFAVSYLFDNVISDDLCELEGVVPVKVIKSRAVF